MTKKLIQLTIMFTLIGTIFIGSYFMIRQDYETIEFNDENFEMVVRDIINQPTGTIYRNQVREITTLNISSNDIEYLDGIEAFSALRILNLENNQIQDLTPLSNLRHLEVLNLRNNKITNLSEIHLDSLINLSSLRELNLRHNVIRPDVQNPGFTIRIEDISLLSNFTQLERLILRDNHIQDIEPLSNLRELTYLDISQNPLVDRELLALSNLYKLEHLNLRETSLTNINILSSFTSLTYLNLHSNTDIETISALGSLINLETLILENVPVQDEIIYLSSLTNLTRLNLRNTGIISTSTLAFLMETGALQDRPALGIYADIDIRDNPILIVDSDSLEGYNPLRAYWQNITYRNPYLLPLDPTREVIINEYMSSNGDTIIDFDGDYSDWIELYNPNDTLVNLSGYYLSDSNEEPFRWRFPQNTVIQPHSYLLVWASGKDKVAGNGEIHTNFSISRSGEPLILTASDQLTLVDQMVPMVVPRNVSYGRYPDGSDNWEFFDRNNITPGSSNNTATPYDIPEWLNPNP